MPKDAQSVVLNVGMSCDACKRKVSNAVSRVPGVYEVTPDLKMQIVTVKGDLDSTEVLKAIRKTRRPASIKELVAIEVKPTEPPKEPSEPPKQPDPPKIVIVTLLVRMHCEHCRRKIERALRSLSGVQNVNVDYKCQKVVVTGTMDPDKVLQTALGTGKYAELLPPPPEKEKEEVKEGKKEEPKEEKKDEAKEEKKEETKEEKKEEAKKEKKEEAKEEKKEEVKEEKKEEAKEEEKEKAKEEKKEEAKVEAKTESKEDATEKQKEKKQEECDEKKQELIDIGARPYLICRGPPNCVTFSDENPNACTIL